MSGIASKAFRTLISNDILFIKQQHQKLAFLMSSIEIGEEAVRILCETFNI